MNELAEPFQYNELESCVQPPYFEVCMCVSLPGNDVSADRSNYSSSEPSPQVHEYRDAT